eukprot:4785839-Prymnesium_polylepis.1
MADPRCDPASARHEAVNTREPQRFIMASSRGRGSIVPLTNSNLTIAGKIMGHHTSMQVVRKGAIPRL